LCKDLQSLNSGQPLEIAEGISADLDNRISVGTYLFYFVARNVESNVTSVSDFGIFVDFLCVARITILDEIVPAVTIDLNPRIHARNVFIQGGLPTAIKSYQFEMVEECRDKQLDSLNYTITNSITSDLPSFKFTDGDLKPGSTYCVSLSITDSSSQIGRVTTEINVPRIPSSGICSLASSDENPIEFHTIVTITCRAWVTEPTSFPLEYSWQIIDGQGDWKTISYTGARSLFSSSAFPAGNYTLGVLIRDQIGSVNTQMFSFEIAVIQESGDTRTSYFANLTAEYAYHKDVKSTLTALALLSSSLGAEDSDLANGIIGFLSNLLFDDEVFASYPLAEIIVGILDAISRVVVLDATRSKDALMIQNEILSTAAQSISNSRMHWFRESFVRKCLEISDRIVDAINERGEDVTAFLELIVSIRQILSENYLINRACGEGDGGIEHVLSYGAYSMYHSYHKSDTFCEAITVSELRSNTCILYSCGNFYFKNIESSISTAIFNSINPYIYAMQFFTLDKGEFNNNTRVKLNEEIDSTSQLLTIEIPIDAEFAIANSILQSTSKNSISCVAFNQTGAWSSEACALVSINTAKATCLCRYDASGLLGLASSISATTSGVVVTTFSDADANRNLTIGLAIAFSAFGLMVIGYFGYLYKIPIVAMFAKVRCPDMSRVFGGKKRKRRVFPMLPTIDENGQLKMEPVDPDDEFTEVQEKQEFAVVAIEGDDEVENVELPEDGDFEVYSLEKEKSASDDVQWPIRM
jgi:hypothetical protein